MPHRESPSTLTVRLLLILLCLLSVGCGITSKRMSLRKGRDELGVAQAAPKNAPKNDLAVAAPTRRPWRSPLSANDAGQFPEQIALVSAEEPVANRGDIRPESDNLSPKAARPANAAASRTVEEVTTDSFGAAVLDSEGPVLVDFYAEWCGPCKRLTPMLDQMASESSDVKIVKVDIDASKKLAKTYGVRSVPTLIVFRNGQPVSHHQGLASRQTVEQMLR